MSVDTIFVSSLCKQGFFSIKSGDLLPISEKNFRRWRKTKIAWWYMFAVITDKDLIETYGVRAWNRAMTPDEHFRRVKQELEDIVRSRNDIVNYIHVMAYPHSDELSEYSINKIVRILE